MQPQNKDIPYNEGDVDNLGNEGFVAKDSLGNDGYVKNIHIQNPSERKIQDNFLDRITISNQEEMRKRKFEAREEKDDLEQFHRHNVNEEQGANFIPIHQGQSGFQEGEDTTNLRNISITTRRYQ